MLQLLRSAVDVAAAVMLAVELGFPGTARRENTVPRIGNILDVPAAVVYVVYTTRRCLSGKSSWPVSWEGTSLSMSVI